MPKENIPVYRISTGAVLLFSERRKGLKNEQKRAVDQECILEPFLLKMIDLDTRSKSVLKLRTVFSKFKIKTVGIPTVSWRRARDSNPRGCYTLLAFQASSLATRSTLRVKVYIIDIQLLRRVFLVAAPLQSSCISSISESEIPDLALSVNPPCQSSIISVQLSDSLSKSITNISYLYYACK